MVVRSRGFRVLVLIAVITVLAAIAGTVLYVHIIKTPKSPISKEITQKVNFPLYYPDQKKLPKGYYLNQASFISPQKDVVLYDVKYGNNQKLIFSVQPKPSDNDLQSFYSSYIPLRVKMQTVLGQADIGAYGTGKNLKTVASLPIQNDNTWIIVTAPYNVNQDQLKKTLNSLRK